MKKLILTSLAAVFAVSSANAAGFYVAGNLNTDNDDNVALFDATKLALSVGYAFDTGLRLEADVYSTAVSYNSSNAFVAFVGTDGFTGSTGFGIKSLEVIYDIKQLNVGVVPYVGFGFLGASYISMTLADNVEVYGSFIAGVSYDVNTDWAVFAEYNRNFAAGWLFKEDGSLSDYLGWSTWKLGALYRF